MDWITGIFSLINGVPKVVDSITGYLGTKVTAATQTEIAKVKSGEAVTLKQEETDGLLATLQQAILLADQQWWATRWIRPGFAYISMFHYGMITLSSVGWISAKIAPLPDPYAWLEIGIIGAFFLLRPLEKNLRKK